MKQLTRPGQPMATNPTDQTQPDQILGIMISVIIMSVVIVMAVVVVISMLLPVLMVKIDQVMHIYCVLHVNANIKKNFVKHAS